jgi:LPS-assembly protein
MMIRVWLLAVAALTAALVPAIAQEAPPPAETPAPPPRQTPVPPPAAPPPPAAQSASQGALPGFRITQQSRIAREGTHWRLFGPVEMEQNDGQQRFFADQVDYWTDTGRLVAVGNVVYSSPDSRIAADKLDYDVRKKIGTFYNAYGSARLGEHVDKSLFGTQEPDAYFYGQQIDKIGPQKYRITQGGFTTCVQPTPRWEMVATTATVKLEDYAILKNTVMRAKGVPVFYLPVMYYPIQSDDRATGFLLPVYGSSNIRGQSLSNAFFWAIDRSQDATIFHDWFSKAGQGVGGEYRYVAGPGSQGQATTYFLDAKEAIHGTSVVPATRSYNVRTNASQALPGRLRAQANVDYFSDVAAQQIYQQNVFAASQRTRTVGANLSGGFRGGSFSASYQSTELFYNETASNLYGAAPRLQLRFAEQRLGPVYVGAAAEYAGLQRRDRDTAQNYELDQGLSRFDVTPGVRVPFTRWQFLTFNTSLAFHNTWYSESLQPVPGTGDIAQVPEALLRQYWDFQSTMVGPVAGKIFDTGGGRWKHVIEPSVTFQRVSTIDNRNQIVTLEGIDYTYGGVTRLQYGVRNRFLVKSKANLNARAREVVNVGVSQTYYTDPLASQFDFGGCASCFNDPRPREFSPVVIDAGANPTERTNARLRMEYDTEEGTVPYLSVTGQTRIGGWVETGGGWSLRNFVTDPLASDKFVNAFTNVRAPSGRVGGSYNFFYDLGRSTLIDQRIMVFYNAQCCGIAFEYQTYNYPQFGPSAILPQDRRFNISFTLAGIGTFSNFLGAFGGNAGSSGYGRPY